MPLINYDRKIIEIEVSDRVVGDTIVKQKAKFTELIHQQIGLVSTASIIVLITLYAVKDGTYGDELIGNGFNPYTKTLIADNNTVVKAETGEILFTKTNESDALWQAKLEQVKEDAMLQGDFFEMLRDTQSILIGDMIKQHIIQANLFGKFN